MTEVWEDQIIGLLRNEQYWAVLPYPELPTNYFVKHRNGEILVRYDSSKYKSEDLGQVHLVAQNVIELIFCFRKRRGEGGLYFALAKAKELLFGYRLFNASSDIVLVREDLIGEDGKGIWEMGLKVQFYSFVVKGQELILANEPSVIIENTTIGVETKKCDGS